jgi:hypothetical protein
LCGGGVGGGRPRQGFTEVAEDKGEFVVGGGGRVGVISTGDDDISVYESAVQLVGELVFGVLGAFEIRHV